MGSNHPRRHGSKSQRPVSDVLSIPSRLTVTDILLHLSSYYGYLFVADLVSELHEPQISPIYSLDAENMAHYAIYSSSRELQKMVILNLDYFNGTTSRAYKTFDVTSVFGKNVAVTRLTGSTSIAQQGLTWAGQTVDGQGKLVGTKVIERVTNGNVSIGSSEAVIVQIA